MDGYNDLYGSDQVRVNPTAAFPSLGYKATTGTPSHIGYYEDNLRFQQYGIPAALRCREENPYIQDPIQKSQRHNMIRVGNIQDRSGQVAHNSCEPGLSEMYGGKACGYASGQRVVHTNNETCAPNLKIDCKSAGYAAPSKKETIEIGDVSIETTTVLYLFIFILLVYMCLTFWKSTNDMKTAVQGGFEQLRDLMSVRV